jgi:hypothetical protein
VRWSVQAACSLKLPRKKTLVFCPEGLGGSFREAIAGFAAEIVDKVELLEASCPAVGESLSLHAFEVRQWGDSTNCATK